MNLYHVWTSIWRWGDYNAFVIVAKDKERALEIAKRNLGENQWAGIHIEEVDLNKEHIVFESIQEG